MRTLFLGLVLAGIWLPSPTPLSAESADATIRTATQQAVWRRTTAGWEHSIDWPRNSASAELTAAAAIHPSIVGLLQLGLIIMAFLLFPAGNMQRSENKKIVSINIGRLQKNGFFVFLCTKSPPPSH